MRKYLSISLFLYALIMSPITRAQDLVIGGYDYPPFMNAVTQGGSYHHLMDAIAQQTGLAFKWQYYPYARLDQLFTQNLVHIEVGSAKEWTINSKVPGEFSNTFYTLEDVAIFRPNEAFSIKTPQDIKGKTVGVVRGYGFIRYDAVFASKQATRFDAKDENQLLNMLYNGRMDVIFINKNVFFSKREAHPDYQTLMMGDVVGDYDIRIRVNPNVSHILPKLNQAIDELTASNIIQIIEQPLQNSAQKKPAN